MSSMLQICQSFFEHLNGNGVRYCHWKSNLNLVSALSGRTDLDILVARSSMPAFNEAIGAFGFKKILSPPAKQFPGLEDYLGFDRVTGALVHLHVHYALVMGEKYIKNHCLPLEELFFNHLVLSPQGVWIPCPELELVILVLRAHLKTDLLSLLKHQIKDCLGQSYNPFPDHIHQEFLELIRNSDLEKVRAIFHESRLPLKEGIIFGFIRELSEGNLRARAVVRRKLQILFGLRDYRRHNVFAAYFSYLSHYLSGLPLVAKFRSPKRKTIWGGGKVFALVGADGSGKSTLVADLESWLSWKVEVRRAYHGIPKTWTVRLGFWVARQFRKLALNGVSGAITAFLWVLIARKRYVTSVQARRFAADGELVLSDRFPLQDFHDMENPMDGPRLSGGDTWISRRESYWYDKLVRPDRLFVLKVAIDELRRRKADLPLDTHMLKAEAVNSIREREGIVVIDANRSYEEVLLQIKRSIWQELLGPIVAEKGKI